MTTTDVPSPSSDGDAAERLAGVDQRGEGRGDAARTAVAGHVAAPHEAGATQHAGECRGDGEAVGPDAVDAHRPVGPAGQRVAQRPLGADPAGGDHHDRLTEQLAVAQGQLQRSLVGRGDPAEAVVTGGAQLVEPLDAGADHVRWNTTP